MAAMDQMPKSIARRKTPVSNAAMIGVHVPAISVKMALWSSF